MKYNEIQSSCMEIDEMQLSSMKVCEFNILNQTGPFWVLFAYHPAQVYCILLLARLCLRPAAIQYGGPTQREPTCRCLQESERLRGHCVQIVRTCFVVEFAVLVI